LELECHVKYGKHSRDAGSLFWPDFWSSNWHNPGPLYDMFNLTDPWEKDPDILTTESGEFLFNR
jgi:hypothetical protein